MPNINTFRPVAHEKIFKYFCYINLYQTMSLRAWPFVTPGTSYEQIYIFWS